MLLRQRRMIGGEGYAEMLRPAAIAFLVCVQDELSMALACYSSGFLTKTVKEYLTICTTSV